MVCHASQISRDHRLCGCHGQYALGAAKPTSGRSDFFAAFRVDGVWIVAVGSDAGDFLETS